MNQHRTDLLALLFGLAFAIAGGLVLVTQATSVDVSPQWGTAVGLIVLGAVALAATLARGAHRMSHTTAPIGVAPIDVGTMASVDVASVDAGPVSSEDPAD